MKEIKAAICDDEETALEMVASALETCFRRYGAELKLDRYSSPLDLERRIGTERYQAVFLDIDMPDLSGIDLGVELKEARAETAIIFVSNYEGKVFDAFQAKPFGFVRKSSFLKDVEAVVKLYMEEIDRSESSEDFIALEVPKEGVFRFSVSDIVYIECVGSYQFVHLFSEKEPVRVRARMYDFEEKLGRHGFLSPHKSFLVNYRYVKKIVGDRAELITGESVIVTRKKRAGFVREYMRLARDG